jgi:hypothetical protein
MIDWLDEVKLLYDYCVKICQVYNAITSIAGVLTAVSAIIGLTSPIWGTPQGAALRTTWVGSCKADSATKKGIITTKQNFFDKLCSFVNCKYSKKALDAMSKDPGFDPEGWNPDKFAGINAAIKKGFDVKESIVWSVATLCIPGIILNLNKYMQVECAYLVCMEQDVAAGMPVEACEAVYAYMSCTFWTGQILNALPFFQMWTNLWESFQQTLSDPLGFIFYFINLGLKCEAQCVPEESATARHKACSILGAVNLLGDAINEIMGMFQDDYWEVGSDEDYCSQWEDLQEDEDDEDDDDGLF